MSSSATTTVSLLLGVAVATVGLLGLVGLDWQRQADAVAAIKSMGGHVVYSESGLLPKAWNEWLADRLGRNRYSTVGYALLPDGAQDAAMPHLKQLNGLFRVDFRQQQPARVVNTITSKLPGVSVRSPGLWSFYLPSPRYSGNVTEHYVPPLGFKLAAEAARLHSAAKLAQRER